MNFTRLPGYWTKGQTSGFLQPTPVASQRENWHMYTPYIAEFWCALSSLSCLIFSLILGFYFLAVVFFFSFLSHSIPWFGLNVLDKIAALCIATEFTSWLLFFPQVRMLTSLGLLIWLDKECPSTYLHIAWHFIAFSFYVYCKGLL